MQMYGNFVGVALQNAWFGVVKYLIWQEVGSQF